MLRSPRKLRRRLVGVEIEPGRVVAVQGGEGDQPTVDRAATAPLDPDIVRDGEVLDPVALGEVLKTLFREHKLDRRVRIGVANGRIVMRTLDLPPIEDEKALAAAVRFQAADELPMALEDAVLDYHSLGSVETDAGPRHRVVVVAARRDMVMQVLAAARAAGLRPEGIDLSAFAMVRALAPSGGPTLLLSVGGLTNLAVARDGSCLVTRVVGAGVEGIAAQVAERRGIPLAEARDVVFDLGLEGPRGGAEVASPVDAPAADAAAELPATDAPVELPAADVPAESRAEAPAPADDRWLGGDLLDPAARPLPKITFGGGEEAGDEPLDPHARPIRPVDEPEEPPVDDERPPAEAPVAEAEVTSRPTAEPRFPAPDPEPAVAETVAAAPVRPAMPAAAAAGAPEDAPGAELATLVRTLLREAVERIAGEARATIDFHLGGQAGAVGAAILTGPALRVPGFREALAAELGLPVEAGTVPAGDEAHGAHAVAAGLTIAEVAA